MVRSETQLILGHSPQLLRVVSDIQCRLAAQLARTEEAAKRLMVRSDRSARGGTAARLLAAEQELSCIAANAVETRGAPIYGPDCAADHAPLFTINMTQPVQPKIPQGAQDKMHWTGAANWRSELAQRTGGPT